MSKDRSNFHLNCPRFGKKSIRIEKQKTDLFASIIENSGKFILNWNYNNCLSKNCTLDEQLLVFRELLFLFILKNQLVMNWNCHANESKYMFHAEPYLGKSTDTQGHLNPPS